MVFSSFVVIVHHRQRHTKITQPVEESVKTGKIAVQELQKVTTKQRPFDVQ
jgi:hypothetical protein